MKDTLKSVAERFWSKVSGPGNACECWEWTGCIQSNGYGRFGYTNGTTYAHRVSYILTFGAIPDGLFLDHLCRNTTCVNPYHLEPVSHAENVRRGMAGKYVGNGRHQSSKTHCPLGHEYVSDNLVSRRRGGRDCKTCHRMRENRRYHACQ